MIAWSLALLLVQAALLALIVLWEFGAFGPSRSPFVSDFPSFYAAGELALQGLPELAYDENAHGYAEQALGNADAPYVYFYYPPPFLLLCAALAGLPYWVAYALFEFIPLLVYGALACRIALVGGWRGWTAAFAFPPVVWCVGLGQNAFLTASLLAAGGMCVDRTPRRAGLLFGLLCIKPHLAMLVPVALIAGRHWRALAAMVASVAAIGGVTLWLFGGETWLAYFATWPHATEVYGSGRVLFAAFVTPFGAARLIGLTPGSALAMQAVVSAGVMVSVGWLWRVGASRSVRGAALLAGTLLCVPVALVYDLMPLGFCIAWLLREGHARGFPPWEKSLLALVCALALMTVVVGWTVRFPLGVFAPAIVLALCMRQRSRPDDAGDGQPR